VRLLFRYLIVTTLSGALLVATGFALVAPTKALLGSGAAGELPISLDALDERSYVYAADGSLLATLHVEQNRAPVKLEAVPQHVIDAILAVEDAEFYAHGGLNLRATMRALRTNVESGGVQQGGSTITQQLVKQTLVGSKRNLDRKTREAVLAVRLEDQMTKDEILERYLNTVYFGNGAYGVQAAAETYFGVDVDKIDTGQAALLAGLISSPEEANPFRFPKNALERRRLALRRLVETGHITTDEAAFYQGVPLPGTAFTVTPPPNDYFVEEVKQSLLKDKRLGETQAERYNAVFRGGLRIKTTFDPNAQQLAVSSRNNVLGSIAPKGFPAGTFPLPKDPVTGAERFGTAAIVSVEPKTGAVRAMVGGPGFDKYKYNLATQGLRQPGSSFKGFVLMALLENGYVPSDSVDGSGPCSFKIPGIAEPYKVENFDNSRGGGGNITSQALRSSNCAFVRLGQIVGLQNVVDTARRMGITTPLDASIFSMPLGSLEVHPLEMAAAYAVIANDGIYNAPYMIERVDDREGKLLFEHKSEGRRAVSVQSARLAAQILQKNVESGTGTRARLPGRPAAGKTGTAQDSGDAWFVGFTPQMSTAVWMGSPVGRVGMRIGGRGVTGGSYPAMMWNRYMAPWHEGLDVEKFPAPGATRKGKYLRVDKKVDAKASTRSGSGTRRRTTTTGKASTGTTDGSGTTEPSGTSPPTTSLPGTTLPP
jgi:penicillin-binding protein 1A